MRETNAETRGGIEIDLQKLLLAYLRRWWLIVLGGVVVGLLSLVITANFITPLYRASVTIYVNNVRADQQVEYITNSNLATAQKLVNTYVNIIESDTVLSKVAESGGLPYTPGQIRNMMSAEQMDETEIFTVSISHEDPQMAAKVANAVANVAPEEIGEIVDGSSTKIIDYAKVPANPYSPNTQRNVMLGVLVGIVLALVYITILFLLDVRIKDAEDIESLFEYPVLGQVPVFAVQELKKKNSYGYEGAASGGKGGLGV